MFDEASLDLAWFAVKREGEGRQWKVKAREKLEENGHEREREKRKVRKEIGWSLW